MRGCVGGGWVSGIDGSGGAGTKGQRYMGYGVDGSAVGAVWVRWLKDGRCRGVDVNNGPSANHSTLTRPL